jgi:hypothetical protein
MSGNATSWWSDARQANSIAQTEGDTGFCFFILRFSLDSWSSAYIRKSTYVILRDLRDEVLKKLKFFQKSLGLTGFCRRFRLRARLWRDKTAWQDAVSPMHYGEGCCAVGFFQDSIIPPRINRRRSYRFDRARHRVFVHLASRYLDRMRAGS